MEGSTIVIDKFLGLHEDSTGGLNIEVGELSTCTNIRVTENYKLKKREGYSQKINASMDNVNLIAVFGSKILVACGTNLFEFDEAEF